MFLNNAKSDAFFDPSRVFQKCVNNLDIDNQRKLFEKKFCKSSALVIDPDTGDSRAAQYKFRHMLTSTVYHQRTGQLFIEIVNTAINNQRIANVQKVQAATTQLAKRSMKYLTKMARNHVSKSLCSSLFTKATVST